MSLAPSIRMKAALYTANCTEFCSCVVDFDLG